MKIQNGDLEKISLKKSRLHHRNCFNDIIRNKDQRTASKIHSMQVYLCS